MSKRRSIDASPRILHIDIETFPNLAYIWGVYEQNALSLERSTIVASFSAKWHGGKQITKALPDYPLYEKDSFDDSALLRDIWALLDEADIAVAHNGDQFDFKKLNARFIKIGLLPPSPYQTVDTLKIARKHFRFESNKLDELGKFLGLGEKVTHTGFKLWQGCMKGDERSWKLMKKYNAQDVKLLEAVYLRFLPWIKNHPNRAAYDPSGMCCPKCGSSKLQARGELVSLAGRKKRYQCTSCGGWTSQNKKSMVSI